MRLWLFVAMCGLGCREYAGLDADIFPAPGDSDTVDDTEPTVPVWPADTASDTDTEGVYEMSGFSFVDPHVAGMPQPGRFVPLADDLQFMSDEGIRLLVSLTQTPVSADEAAAFGIDHLHLPIEDFQPPTLEQQLTLVGAITDRIEAGERVGVHCTAGIGRTGTMLATWFVATGLSADDAIAEVRGLRPGSIETAAQELSVHTFERVWTSRGTP